MPIIMSVVVLLMVIVEFWRYGPHPAHHDEGTADHIAMLLMFGQIPMMFWLTAPWRHRGRRVLPTLAIQLSLWAVTFASAVMLS
jgi:type VI protein secretion system component VasK